jgi:nucleotide-binding universal stress UspA family protein
VARDRKRSLLIVHAKELSLKSDEDAPDDVLRKKLEELPADGLAVPVRHLLLHGADPVDTICRLAEREKVDLIVMGTHGRRGLMRLLMGSVAELVVRHANCPVMIVKQPTPAN